jgi:hypothetical protein
VKMGAKAGADGAGTFATGMVISPAIGFFIRKAVSSQMFFWLLKG